MYPQAHLEREIQTQAENWTWIIQQAPRWAAVLPRAGERVAVIGCGTSWFIGQAYAARREEFGQGLSDAWTATEHRWARAYDRVLLISRSGTTSEVLAVLQRLTQEGVAHTAIVASANTPIADLAQNVVLLSEVDEHSVVQTRFATTVLALLRASLGEDMRGVIAQARQVLAEPDAHALGELPTMHQLTLLGTGWGIGVAHEAALKLRETAQLWTESYPAMEYRHGPMAVSAPRRAVWVFGQVPQGMAGDVLSTGAHFEYRANDPMVELVRAQRLAVYLARDRDLDPDHPRNLTRSIILEHQ